MERNNIDLVLAGVDPLDGEALELLTYVRRKHREVPVILLFPRLHPERAKEALRLGAMAVLKYPVPAAELRAAVLQALERCETRTDRTRQARLRPPCHSSGSRPPAAAAAPAGERSGLPAPRCDCASGPATKPFRPDAPVQSRCSLRRRTRSSASICLRVRSA